MDFKNDVDVAGHLVHGSYIDNLSRIIVATGVYPPNILDDELKPVVGYLRKPKILHPDKLSVCELYTHPFGYEYSLQEQQLWGIPAFHFIIVSNYPYRNHSKSFEQLLSEGIEPSEYSDPWHYEGNEIALKNQGLSIDTFVALVLPTDKIISDISRFQKYEPVFSDLNGCRMDRNRIKQIIRNQLDEYELELPIFDMNGDHLD